MNNRRHLGAIHVLAVYLVCAAGSAECAHYRVLLMHKHRDHRLLSVYQMEQKRWRTAVQCEVVRLSLCCCQTSVEESVLKMETAGCSETLIPTFQTIPAVTSCELTHVFRILLSLS